GLEMIQPSRISSSPITRLPEALALLATRMHEAVAERRRARPGTVRYERADEYIAHLNELYVRLQQHMEIPSEIWLLEDSRFSAHGRGTLRHRPSR
ncbi:MAG: hypothetical protein ACC726_17465, partial [Chloroflexota bacterium]